MMDEFFLSKLQDGILIAESRPFFVGFLDESEVLFSKLYLNKRKSVNYKLWGGFEDAQRKILGIFPRHFDMDSTDDIFPIVAITLTFRKVDILSHRDFLGALLSLGIKRQVLGDLLIEEGRCVCFLKKEMEDYFLNNITTVGRTGVNTSSGYDFPLPDGRKYSIITGTISSQRLDCIVAFLCKVSRGQAAVFIKNRWVKLNYTEMDSPRIRVNQGDVLSVLRNGKFVIDQFGALTKKGRLTVQCRKYE